MHDARMLAASHLHGDLENFAYNPAGRESAYMGTQCTHLGFYVQAPFRYGILTRQMQMFNKAMSAVRAFVEWLFRDIINFFF